MEEKGGAGGEPGEAASPYFSCQSQFKKKGAAPFFSPLFHPPSTVGYELGGDFGTNESFNKKLFLQLCFFFDHTVWQSGS